MQHLDPHQILTLRDHEALTLHCRDGALWITQADNATDYLLVAGESLHLDANPHTLVEALRSAALALDSARPVHCSAA